MPLALFAAALVFDYGVLGRSMRFDPTMYQFLDLEALRHHPGTSLLLLHGQPPLLNVVLGIAAGVAGALGLHLETVLGVLFAAAGAVTAVGLQRLVLEWTGSPLRALACVALYLVEPALYVEHTAGVGLNFFFYEHLLQPVLVLLAWALIRWHKGRSTVEAAAAIALVGVAVNLRSLCHPLLWGTPIVILVVLGTRAAERSRWRAAAFGAAALLVFGWSAKNAYLFGAFTNSSWDAYGLSRGFVPPPVELRPFLGGGGAPDGTPLLARFPHLAAFGADSLRVVTAPTKRDGSANWNHLLFLTTRADLTDRALAARSDLGRDVAIAGVMYALSTRAMYLHPYTGRAFGKSPAEFEGWLWLYDRMLYLDVSAILGDTGEQPGLTLFGLVWLPLLVVLAVAHARRVPDERFGLATLGFLALFPLAVACATDGVEGNRMRYSTFAVIACVTVRRDVG